MSGKCDFSTWFSTMQEVPYREWTYYTDFKKVYENALKWKRSLCLMNSLVGSENIKEEFISLVTDYPEVIQCIPMLLACREVEMDFYSAENYFHYDFDLMNQSPEEYAVMMENTGAPILNPSSTMIRTNPTAAERHETTGAISPLRALSVS